MDWPPHSSPLPRTQRAQAWRGDCCGCLFIIFLTLALSAGEEKLGCCRDTSPLPLWERARVRGNIFLEIFE